MSDLGWAVLELMGHRRLAGYISEREIAGAKMLQIEVPARPPATQLYAPQAVFCITPTDEQTAREIALTSQPGPVARWQLPQGQAELPDADLVPDDPDDVPY